MSSVVRDWVPIVEVGLELLGVPFGVRFGVEDALSTLALLDPDLGVMFELRNALTGVAMSPFGLPVDTPFGTVRPSFRRVGDSCRAGEPANFGVNGFLLVRIGGVLFVFAIGRSLCCLSNVLIVRFPLRSAACEQVCGPRIMTL